MRDLIALGKALRELREGRGIPQTAVIKKSDKYSEPRTLRKIESGEMRPKRADLIAVLVKGLDERNTAKIDELLGLAGYEPLRSSEIKALALERVLLAANANPQPINILASAIPAPSISTPSNPDFPLPATPLSPRLIRNWNRLIAICGLASIPLIWIQDWFIVVCCFLYAGLFVTSMLLESAHQFRGREASRAAVLTGSAILATSLAATHVETSSISAGRTDGLWFALLIFVAAAILQWGLVRPALSADPVVRTRFQPYTAQAAHLKNTVYFLLVVFAFWMPPRNCIEVLAYRTRMGMPGSSGAALKGVFCPQPVWLWIVFVLLIVISVPMGSRLLDNLRPSSHHNLYVSLFWLRALIYFLLSAICLIWYSSHF